MFSGVSDITLRSFFKDFAFTRFFFSKTLFALFCDLGLSDSRVFSEKALVVLFLLCSLELLWVSPIKGGPWGIFFGPFLFAEYLGIYRSFFENSVSFLFDEIPLIFFLILQFFSFFDVSAG